MCIVRLCTRIRLMPLGGIWPISSSASLPIIATVLKTKNNDPIPSRPYSILLDYSKSQLLHFSLTGRKESASMSSLIQLSWWMGTPSCIDATVHDPGRWASVPCRALRGTRAVFLCIACIPFRVILHIIVFSGTSMQNSNRSPRKYKLLSWVVANHHT